MTLKVVSESSVMWATSMLIILVFLGLAVLDLCLMYTTDRQTSDRQMTDVRQHHYLMRGQGIAIYVVVPTLSEEQ